jgi:hypothetical protein
MTSVRQNVLETKTDRRRVALHFEVVWSKKGKENPMAGAAGRKREPARLEGLTFPVLVAKSADFAVCRDASREDREDLQK